ncbi:MAG: M67 family metallopeptidase [Lentisphaerae bacterium]|nr:M67 family metallopeptidase [Lentisphaerota bacterium]
MKLVINPDIYEAMLGAASKAAPLEACGLLGGTEGCAGAFYELMNTDGSGEHYSMAPEEQFAAIKDMRKKGFRMIAIWHSHPATPARMSEEDLRMAYTPDVVYVILSLATPDSPKVRGYITEDGSPVEIDIGVVPLSTAERSEAS